jgi:TamB, inner membrane protein subunit of TAM complex
LRRIAKILSRVLLVLLLLLLTVWVLIQLTPVQNFLVRQASVKLSRELKTEVSVNHVDFSLFNKMLLEGVLVKDKSKDTLAYVGRAALNITDWFFLKEKIEISYLGLEDTKLYMHRKDSVWNYQFLIDYFAPPSTGKKTKKSTALSLKKLQLKNISLQQKDEWRGENMEGSVSWLQIDIDKFDLAKKNVAVKNITIHDPLFSITNYEGKRPKKKSKAEEDWHVNDSIVKWNTQGWRFSANTVSISNGEFRNSLTTEREPFTYFDGAHLRFHSINGSFNNLLLQSDTLKAEVSLNAKERSGFTVTNMKANMLFHTTGMEFHDLLLQTPNSVLKDFFALRYTQFNHDMSEFISHVRMDGNFNDSKIHSDDIAFFAPELKDWKDAVRVTGAIRGTVDHLKGNDLKISTLKNTLFDGSFTMDGLPDINNTFLNINARKFKTNYAEASQIYPGLRAIKRPAINQISFLDFTGLFTGYLKDFVTYGTIRTNLGTVTSDLNLKLPDGLEPIYSGKLKTDGFQLGRFLNEKSLGRISMDGTLKGKSFSVKKLFAEVDGEIRQIELNGYNYKNITAKGIVDRRKFDGALAVNDSNLMVNLTGIVDFGKDTPVYRINGMVYRFNMKPLGFTRNELSVKGDIDFNFKVKSIEDFMGSALIQNAELINNGKKLSFDSLYLSNHFITSNSKEFLLRSNEIDARLRGNYSLIDLPDVALNFLHNYFPAYIPQPTKKLAEKDFEFDIVTKNISEYIDLLNLPLRGFDQSTLKGNFNIKENRFNLEAHVPSFEYNKVFFENVNIIGSGNLTNLALNGTVSEIRLSDSLRLPNSSFTVNAAKDTGSVTIKTSATQTFKDANLNARFNASKQGFNINFQPSTVFINDKRWTIEDQSNLFIGKGELLSSGIKLTSGNEEIFAYSEPSSTLSSGHDFKIELKKLEVGDILPYFLKDPRLEGSVTGGIEIINPMGKMQVEGKLKAEKFRMNNDSIGIVTLQPKYNAETGIIEYNIQSDNRGHEFTIEGLTNIKDPKNIQTDNLIKFNNEQLTLLNKYLSVIMTDIKGVGNGTLRVKGNGTAPEIIGDVTLTDASFVLDYTKCRYKFKNGTVISFKEGMIDFGSVQLSDTTDRKATFSGILYHRFFNEMVFDLAFAANDAKRGLVVLNTTKRDNSLFYGNVVANAGGSITGPANKINLQLRGVPTDSSKLYLPTSDSRITGVADFIVFRKYGKEMKALSEVKESSTLNVDLTVTANPYAKVFLILDEITNDVIEGQGNGVINLKVGTSSSTTMTGNFNITQGKYTFNWESLFKRPFIINSGSINWNGDPYDAKIDIDATYLVENAKLPDDLTNGCSKDRNDLLVIANMSKTLKNPLIKFRFELPLGHPCRNNPLTVSGLNQLYNNPDELNRQVMSLLLVGDFLSTTSAQGTNISTSILTNAASTLSEFLAQQVEVGIGVLFKNIPGLNKLELDPYVTFNPALISGFQAQNFEGMGRFGVTKRFLNGRILIKAGGAYLLAGSQTPLTGTNNQLTPDVNIEWLISPDGKFRLIGFYRTVIDAQSRRNRSGISLSYIKDFEKFW